MLNKEQKSMRGLFSGVPPLTRAILGFRGLWVSWCVEHVVFMTGGIRSGLAAVCVWIVYDWVGSVQNHVFPQKQ